MFLISIFIGIVVIQKSSATSGSAKLNYIEKYFNEIKAGLDLATEPCKDFMKYTCNNQINEISEDIEDITEEALKALSEKMESINNPNKTEQKVKNFLISCHQAKDLKLMFEQVGSLKSIGKWPTDRTYTNTEIADLMAGLYFHNKFLKLDAYPNELRIQPSFSSPTLDIESIIKLLQEIGTSEKDASKFAKDILEFQHKLKIAESAHRENTEEIPVGSISNLQENAPNFDWEEYFKILRSKLDIDLDKVYWNPDLVRTVLEAFIDSKGLANFLVFNYVQIFSQLSCSKAEYLKPMLMHLNSNIANENVEKYEKYLILFEQQMSKLTEKIPAWNKTNLGEMRENFSVAKKIQNIEFWQEYYEGIEVQFDKYFTNLINIVENFYQLRRHADKSITVKYFQGNYHALLKFFNEERPALDYFLFINKNLWDSFLHSNEIFNETIAETCFKKSQGKDSISKNLTDALTVEKVNYLSFMQFIEEGGEKSSEEYLKSIGLNHVRAYFIKLAQRECKNKLVIEHLSELKEFRNAFECLSDSSKVEEDCITQSCTGGACPIENLFSATVGKTETP